MHVADATLVLTATDLSAYAACPHLTAQDLAATQGGPKPPKFDDPGREVLQQRGHEHEARLLAAYRAEGLEVVSLTRPERGGSGDGARGGEGGGGSEGGEARQSDEVSEARQAPSPHWHPYAQTTLDHMRAGVDVIHQGCLFDGRWLGLPDFLVKVDRPSDLGAWSYEVVDAKLARSAKVGAVLQICSYSDLLGAVQGVAPEEMHLALGGAGGELESFRVPHFAAYYRSVKARFEHAIEAQPTTYPEPVPHCVVCKWSPVCDKRWRADDHLSRVAGISRKQRSALQVRGITTLEALAEAPESPHTIAPPLIEDGVSPNAYRKIREQARIQLEGRREGRPKHELLLGTDPKTGEPQPPEPDTGLLALPEPSPGDLFFDIEGDPHALDDGLEYLLGWVDAEGAFTRLWAFDAEEERRAFEAYIDMLMARLERWPELHVYHYADYEKTALKRLAARYATREDEVDRLLRGRVLVDLHRVVRQGLRASVESYSIKKLEPLYGFHRDVELREASSALAHFEAWLQLGGRCGGAEGGEARDGRGARDGSEAMADGSASASGPKREEARALLDEIERYNRDDCISTLRLREWLEARRPELEAMLHDRGLLEGPLPRPERPDADPSEAVEEEDEEVRALLDRLTSDVPAEEAERTGEEHARWLLAHLLSWHRREKKSEWWEYFRLMELDDEELIAEPKPVGGLEYEGVVDTVQRSLVHRYRFPPQDLAIPLGRESRDPRTGKPAGEVVEVDEMRGTLDIKRGKRSKVPHPTALIPVSIVPDKVLKKRLRALAREIADRGLEGAGTRAAAELLLRRRPRAGQGDGEPLRGPDETNLDAARRIAPVLDHTVLPIQGPPGSGKTYIGARMITRLIRAGQRVGVTGPSHKVIVNLLDEVGKAAGQEGLTFSGIQKTDPERGCAHESIECIDDNGAVEDALAEGESISPPAPFGCGRATGCSAPSTCSSWTRPASCRSRTRSWSRTTRRRRRCGSGLTGRGTSARRESRWGRYRFQRQEDPVVTCRIAGIHTRIVADGGGEYSVHLSAAPAPLAELQQLV